MAEPTEAPPTEQEPSFFSKITLVGVVWSLRIVLKEILAEMRETNRLRRLYYASQGIPTVKLADPRTQPKDLPAAVKDDVEITQPTDQYFAELESRRQALRARGIYVDDNDDLDELERQTDGQ